MLRFKLSANDTLEQFLAGLDTLGPIDVVTRHENRFRETMLLGRAYAYSQLGGCMRPLVIHWRGRIDIPCTQRHSALAQEIDRAVGKLCGQYGGFVQRDIRSEARSLHHADVKKLVCEDIERGDLPNRLLFQCGLQYALYTQIGKLYRNVGHDPNFDWQQVRVTFDGAN